MKLKQIAAAAFIAAASLPAMASIALPQTGNGELVLVVWDGTDQVSYTRDLGIFMDDFNGNADLSFSLTDANFLGFLGIADNTTPDFGDLRFAVFAGDLLGVKRLFSTVDQALTPYNNGNMNSGTAFLNTYENNQVTLSLNTTHAGPAAINGTSYDTAPNGAYFLTSNGPTFQGTSSLGGWTNSNLINTDAIFRSFSSVGVSGGTQTARSDFAGLWSVNNAGGNWVATYTVAAIPEAGGLGMLLAGFGALGLVARRRRSR